MAVLAAVEYRSDGAVVVTGRTSSPLTILNVAKISLAQPPVDVMGMQDGASAATAGVRYSVGTVPGDQTLFHFHALPFSDPRKLEQIVPLQLQDLVPFDVDGFVVDSFVVGTRENGDAEVLSSLVPAERIQEAIEKLGNVGIQPRILTTRAAAVSHLPLLCPEVLQGTFALLAGDTQQLSLVIFTEDHVRFLREFPRGGESLVDECRALSSAIRASLVGVERSTGVPIERLYAIACPCLLLEQLSTKKLAVLEMDLGRFVERAQEVEQPVDSLAWAIGLFLGEENRKEIVNFRRGPFAYRARWDKVLTPLREEATYIRLAAVTLLLWLVAVLYDGNRTLGKIEGAIAAEVKKVLPTETLPAGRETTALQRKIDELEEQLRTMGTLSSLSPLGALREAAEAIPPGMNVEFDAVSIGSSRMQMTGSVPDIPSVGRLNSALEKRKTRFCDVKVDAKGRTAGTSRTRFTADIALCE